MADLFCIDVMNENASRQPTNLLYSLCKLTRQNATKSEEGISRFDISSVDNF